jgi:hypothetical protein
MTKNRTLEQLVAIWTSFNDDERDDFINSDDVTAREVYIMDQAGLLSWSVVVED